MNLTNRRYTITYPSWWLAAHSREGGVGELENESESAGTVAEVRRLDLREKMGYEMFGIWGTISRWDTIVGSRGRDESGCRYNFKREREMRNEMFEIWD
ncbi:hypothetical protein HanXRQr2_Chr17g0778661 [Helianthus annuus]|uniref:Uncharacterized protein n=1 Tax=Helianthus annuus TaxID=4232 RepID=A0A9K3DGB5_HELAN|nr:hypothetical protein HanXRQr2_Chr17g0778661 [Helianthus annuus]